VPRGGVVLGRCICGQRTTRDRDKTGVTEIRLKSLRWVGWVTVAIGILTAVFQWIGTMPVASDWLKRWASGAANVGAPSLRNQAGIPSNRPFYYSVSRSRNTSVSLQQGGTGRASAPLSPLLALPNVIATHQRLVYLLHSIRCGTIIAFAL